MPIIGWIRDLFGIQKDMYDTKRTRLEIKKLEDAEREKTLITPATIEDVKKYDPKIQKLLLKIIEKQNRPTLKQWKPMSKSQLEQLGRIIKERQKRKRRIVVLTLLIAVLLFACMVIYLLSR